MSDLSKISIGIKTFLRDEKMMYAVNGILVAMPEVQIIVADDGDPDLSSVKEEFYADLVRHGHKVILLPYDSGFGMKSNKIVEALERDFLLIGSDDFNFKPVHVRQGIEKMLEILENNPDVHIASGRVGQHGAYEFDLEDLGDTIIEHRVEIKPEPDLYWVRCDLTVNYSLIRKEVFSKVRWDQKPDVSHSIGGCEHGMFFLDVKRAGYKVAFVPGAYINEQEGLDSKRYRELRARSNSPKRECCDLRGVKRYVLGNGRDDYNIL